MCSECLEQTTVLRFTGGFLGAALRGLLRDLNKPLSEGKGRYLLPGTSRQKDRDDWVGEPDVHFINGLPQDFFFHPYFLKRKL